ncbi:MAG: hypothetical protein DRJ69_04700 [Thermoprotei archaeon]|nr:MAG: hypothetical protein DRJ69_04700 [Thermoprotei archaeon]
MLRGLGFLAGLSPGLSQGILDTVKELLDQFFNILQGSLVHFLTRLLELVIVVARASYIAIGLIGLILWLSHISPYRGRGMVAGAILMAVISEAAARLLLP